MEAYVKALRFLSRQRDSSTEKSSAGLRMPAVKKGSQADAGAVLRLPRLVQHLARNSLGNYAPCYLGSKGPKKFRARLLPFSVTRRYQSVSDRSMWPTFDLAIADTRQAVRKNAKGEHGPASR